MRGVGMSDDGYHNRTIQTQLRLSFDLIGPSIYICARSDGKFESILYDSVKSVCVKKILQYSN